MPKVNIPTENAQTIVDQIKEVICHDLNFMDEQGYIIASTDPRRIGTLHAGARKLLESGENILVVESDNQEEGTRRGVNLPIFIQGECVGVIGITGDPQDVTILGTTIQKMTEIMLISIQQQEALALQENSKFNFIESWLFSDTENLEGLVFQFRANLLGIDLNAPRIVCVMDYKTQHRTVNIHLIHENELKEAKIIRYLRSYIGHISADNLCFSINEHIVLIFKEGDVDFIRERMQKACVDIKSFYGVDCYCGIGMATDDYTRLGECYKQAMLACNTVMSSGMGQVTVYSVTSLHYLIQCIPQKVMKNFEENIFRDFSEGEKKESLELLSCYFQMDGNISKAAEKMFIHANTFLYRLNAFKKKTGLNPRSPKDAGQLSILINYYQMKKNN